MNTKDVIDEIEKEELENLPAFKALKSERKIKALKKDIKTCLKARKQINYYENIENQSPVFQKLVKQGKYLELVSMTRASLRLGVLTDQELHDYVTMLEQAFETAKKTNISSIKQNGYDFVTTGCAFVDNAIKGKNALESAVNDLRDRCEEMLESYYLG